MGRPPRAKQLAVRNFMKGDFVFELLTAIYVFNISAFEPRLSGNIMFHSILPFLSVTKIKQSISFSRSGVYLCNILCFLSPSLIISQTRPHSVDAPGHNHFDGHVVIHPILAALTAHARVLHTSKTTVC